MMPILSANTRLLAAIALVAAVFVTTPLLASPSAIHRTADDGGHNQSAAGDAEPDQPQNQPDADAPSEDGTDGANGGNSAQPPAGCLFRDGPLELVV